MKKNTALILVMLAIISVFSACKNDQKASDTVPVLTWYMPGDKQTEIASVMEEVNKLIEPKIGAKLDVHFLDTGVYQEKLTMMIASSNNFDLCFTSDWAGLFLPNVIKGAYMDLTPLIEKNAPKLKTELPDYLYNAATVKGKIYAVPNLQVLFYQMCQSVKKEYAEKYGFNQKSIKNMQELEPLLEKIKQNEPDIYPYRPNYGAEIFTSPVYEEISSSGVGIRKDGSNYKVVALAKTDEFKNGIRLLRKWFEKGYIRSDVNSVMNDDSELIAGKYGMHQAVYKPGAEAELKVKLGREVSLITIEEPYMKSNAGMPAMTAIGRNSKNAELAIKLLELVNTDKEIYNTLCFGMEGKNYNKIENDRIEIIKDSGYTPNAAWKFGNQFNAFLLPTQNENVWKDTRKMNEEAMKSPISGFVLDTDPIKNELSQLATVKKEYSVLHNGSEDPDKIYDKYIAALEQAGHSRIVEEVQRQIDEWIKSK